MSCHKVTSLRNEEDNCTVYLLDRTETNITFISSVLVHFLYFVVLLLFSLTESLSKAFQQFHRRIIVALILIYYHSNNEAT